MADDHGEHGGGGSDEEGMSARGADGHGGGEHGGGHEGGDHSGGEHGGEGHGGEHGPTGGPVGQVAGGVKEGLEGVSELLGDGEDTEDARKGLETAAAVAEGVQEGAKAGEEIGEVAEGLQHGDYGEAAGSLGGAVGSAGEGVSAVTGGIADVLPEGEAREGFREASRVAGEVGQVARDVGEIIEEGAEFLQGLLDQRAEVHFHLEVDGSEIHWTVHGCNLHEALGELSSCHVEASCSGNEHIEEEDFLAKDIGLVIERGEERRSFRGIVRHCSVRHADQRNVVSFDIAAALWLAAETLDSRIYQDVTVPDLVEQIVNELLGDRHRSVRKELANEGDYEEHEYLVQHRESHWEFMKRLCQEEGIFLYFDHDEEDHEVLVLGDSNDNRPLVRPDHDGVIEFEENENQAEGREVATHVSRYHRVGTTDAAVRGFDWSNPGLNVHQEHTDRASWEGPRLERYEHDHPVRHHRYDDGGGTYQTHTADRVARMQTERLDLARQQWTITTRVVTAMPGHIFELRGADVYDRRYLIVSASSHGAQNEHGGTYENVLTCIPADMPYRPPAPERRRMTGPETATVVGPSGEEIHTDKHGRIKVQFHWDRQGQNDEKSSAWIRVQQGWSGPGWGMIFIPRIGMEVVVSFLGGDPDRPLVTGCVYNGQNPPPYTLPDEKTKSTIKTNSSLGGDGYNELRFEDKAGEEEVWIHAQKDFNEVVENDHTTHVKNCQTNTVDVDQTETVGNDQKMTVHNNRTKTVDKDETNTIKMNRTTEVGQDGGDDKTTVHQNQELTVVLHRKKEVGQGEETTIQNGQVNNVAGGVTTIISGDRTETVQSKDELNVQTQRNINVGESMTVAHTSSGSEMTLTDHFWVNTISSFLRMTHQQGRVEIKDAGKIEAYSGIGIELKCGESTVKIGSSKIEIHSPTVEINGRTKVDVKGAEVNLKP